MAMKKVKPHVKGGKSVRGYVQKGKAKHGTFGLFPQNVAAERKARALLRAEAEKEPPVKVK